MASIPEGTLLWQPSPERLKNARLTAYMAWLLKTRGLTFADYNALWQWSVDEIEAFWASIWEYYEIKASAPYKQVLKERKMPRAVWFEGAHLNYAEHCLRHAAGDRPAIIFESELCARTEVSWDELKGQVAALANALKKLGVKPGDRVVAYMPNIPQTVVALLAVASIGAIWSSASPDMGHVSVIDRFRQIEPRVMLAVDGYRYGGRDFDRREIVREILSHLPSVEKLLLVPYLDPATDVSLFPQAMTWADAMATSGPLEFAQVAFDRSEERRVGKEC